MVFVPQRDFAADLCASPQPAESIAILIVGFRNSDDINSCLSAISRMVEVPAFDVFICENGGRPAYDELVLKIAGPDSSCVRTASTGASHQRHAGTFSDVQRLRLRNRPSAVWVGCAHRNLGYAGGINAWLNQIIPTAGWKGIWILNPDTEPEPSALAALVRRAELGGKGMVGSTIMEAGETDRIRQRGGIHWQKFPGRGISIGLNDLISAPHNVSAVETAIDSLSGCSMYVTRACLEKIGLMDDRFFLFFEDLDWGARAKRFGLGYAVDSIVFHKRGSTTGSANRLVNIPKLSVYLEHRNGIHFVRRHYPRTLPFRVTASVLYAVRFFAAGAPKNGLAALAGLVAGLRKEFGPPPWHRDGAPE